jgi:hypothetical protein
MDSQKILRYVGAYAGWVAVSALGIWILLISRSTILGLATKYYINDMFMRQTLTRFLDKAYMVIGGLAWFAMVIIAEGSFRDGVSKRKVFKRFGLIFSIELLLVFCFDLTILSLQNWRMAGGRLVILATELIVGIGLLFVRAKMEKGNQERK